MSKFQFYLPFVLIGYVPSQGRLTPRTPSGKETGETRYITPNKETFWWDEDDLLKGVRPPQLMELCDVLNKLSEGAASASKQDILWTMINTISPGAEKHSGFLELAGAKAGAFPTHPEKSEMPVVSGILFDGDCDKSDEMTAAHDALEGWLRQSNRAVAVCVNAPGTGKSKAAVDLLRQYFGFYLDLSDDSRDEQWKFAWEQIKLTIQKGDIESRYKKMITLALEKGSTEKVDEEVSLTGVAVASDEQVAQAEGKGWQFELVKKTVRSLQVSLFSQIAAVLLGRAVTLYRLREALGPQLTPEIWAIFQTTHAASEVFSVCTDIIKKRRVYKLTAATLMQRVVSFLRGSELVLLGGQIFRFPVFSDEFQVLASEKNHDLHGG